MADILSTDQIDAVVAEKIAEVVKRAKAVSPGFCKWDWVDTIAKLCYVEGVKAAEMWDNQKSDLGLSKGEGGR